MTVLLTIPGVIRKKQGERFYCFGTIRSDRVKDISLVPISEPNPKKNYLLESTEEGYQRPGSPSRMRLFMKFLEEHPNSVVPPVLLSSRGQWNFVPSVPGGDIGSIEVRGQAAVVDGQHRLGGYVALFEKQEEVRDVAFILLENLDLADEKAEFVVVNNSQKGVPKALTAYLENDEATQVAWTLNVDPDSPFHGRIARAITAKSHLFKLHSFAKELKGLFKIGALDDLDIDTKVEFAERYFTIISDSYPTEWADIEKLDEVESKGARDFEYKMLELTGLIAWCNVGSLILHRSYSEHAGMNWENVERLVKLAGDIDWSKDGPYAGRTGTAGGTVIGKDMQRLLPPEGNDN